MNPRPMTLRAFQRVVRVLIVPEPGHVHTADGHLPGDATFWLHTSGMCALGRSELELRRVPALFTTYGGQFLTEMGHQSLSRPILPGDTVIEPAVVQVLLRATKSADPFWSAPGSGDCLTLTPEQVAGQCAACGGDIEDVAPEEIVH